LWAVYALFSKIHPLKINLCINLFKMQLVGVEQQFCNDFEHGPNSGSTIGFENGLSNSSISKM